MVGAGPNGLAGAIALARAGLSVTVLEQAERIGGGTRTEALTLPGFRHDVCSAIHPLGIASPWFSQLPLADFGLRWIHAPAPLAHPFVDGSAATLERDVRLTAAALGSDERPYLRLLAPFLAKWESLLEDVLAPLHVFDHPVLMARFGLLGLQSTDGLVGRFRGREARALLGGLAAHGMLPLARRPSAAFALVLALAAHGHGWPLVEGGSESVAIALARYFESLGGRIETGRRVERLTDIPPSRVTLLDVTPRQFLAMAPRLTGRYRRALERYRYGPAAFKVDWALSAPIPWRAAACARAATVHLVGPYDELKQGTWAAWRGEHPDRPFVLLAQPTLFDATRAPPGKHVAWAYCHVPHGSTVDMTARIESQVERFAPGFRNLILQRHAMPPAALERHNPNLVGGDINGGAQDLRQLFTRPVWSLAPYRTALRGVYLCSASTPPGGGVHGMCGYHAARTALRDLRKRPSGA